MKKSMRRSAKFVNAVASNHELLGELPVAAISLR